MGVMSHIILTSPIESQAWATHFSDLKQNCPHLCELWHATIPTEWLLEVATNEHAYYFHIEFQSQQRVVIAAEVVSDHPVSTEVAKHMTPFIQWWLVQFPGTQVLSHTLGHALKLKA